MMMNRFRLALLAGAAFVLPLSAATAASTPEELEALVRQQAEQIRVMQARLDALEGRQQEDHKVIAQTQAVLPRVIASGVRPTPAAPVTSAEVEARVEEALARHTGAKPADIQVEWGQGAPILRSADGYWSFKPRGRILMDVSTTTGSRYDARDITTTGSRALRLGIEGGAGKHFFYQFESDWADNDVDIVTAFMGYRGAVGRYSYDVRVGNLFNDRGFEGGSGSDSTPFLERNTVGTAILPQRGFYGIGAQGRLYGKTWHLSVAATGDDVDGAYGTNDSRTVIVRGHWNPVKTDRTILHVGLWGFDENLSGAARTITRNTVIGGRFNGNLRVSTGAVTGATGDTGYGGELGAMVGSLWVMGEAGRRDARLSGDRADLRTDAWSLSTGFFVTGEKPPYNARTGNFTQPHVKKSVFDGGSGAFELTARYERLDFKGVSTGGDGWAATAGVNWYLNDFTRLMLNGIQWHSNNRAGAFTGGDDGQTISLRAAVSF
jgi:phosphate-selective porin OprO/OprP